MNHKKLGILLRLPPEGAGEAPLATPPGPAEARALREAFLEDLLARLGRLKKVAVTVFRSGRGSGPAGDAGNRGPSSAKGAAAPRVSIDGAFRALLCEDGGLACLIGGESPDLPLVYVKRAYVKLKHKDIVIGPTLAGGCYLVGMKRHVPGLFEDLAWGTPDLLSCVLRAVEDAGLSCAILPPWYEADTPQSLAFLETMMSGRRLEKRDRLHAVEKALETMRKDSK